AEGLVPRPRQGAAADGARGGHRPRGGVLRGGPLAGARAAVPGREQLAAGPRRAAGAGEQTLGVPARGPEPDRGDAVALGDAAGDAAAVRLPGLHDVAGAAHALAL